MKRLDLALIKHIQSNTDNRVLEIEGDVEITNNFLTQDQFWNLLSQAFQRNTTIEELYLLDIPGDAIKKLIEILPQLNSAAIKHVSFENNPLSDIVMVLPTLTDLLTKRENLSVCINTSTDEFLTEKGLDQTKTTTSYLNERLVEKIKSEDIAILEIKKTPWFGTMLPHVRDKLFENLYFALLANTSIRKIILNDLTPLEFSVLLGTINDLFEDPACHSNIRKVSIDTQSLASLEDALPELIEFNRWGEEYSVALNVFINSDELKLEQDFEPLQKRRRTNGGNHEVSHFFEKKLKNFSSATPPDVQDVSAYNNNCGLYALALGASIEALDKAQASLTNIPDFVRTLQVGDVILGATKLDHYGKLLRGVLYQALEADEVYKNLRKQTFINICFTGVVEPDAMSFALSNRDYILALKDQVELLEGRLFSLTSTYNSDVTLTPDEIEQFYTVLKSFFLLDSMSLNNKIAEYLSQHAQLSEIVKFVHLFIAAWNKVLVSDASPEIRQETKTAISQTIYHVISNHLAKFDEESADFAKRIDVFIKLLALGDLGHKDTNSNLNLLYCYYRVNRDWEDCYKNYLIFLRDTTVMITADELGSIAKLWKIKLTIEFSNKRVYQSEDNNYPLSVLLWNPSQIHWQVKLRDVEVAEIIEEDSVNDGANLENGVFNYG